MTNSAIFGKKGSIAKIDTDSLEALWLSNLSKNYKPTNISNYKNYILAKKAGFNFLAYRSDISSRKIFIDKKLMIIDD